MNVEDAIRAYINMRDTLSAEDRKFKEYKSGIVTQMEVIERYIQKKLDETGADNLSIKGIGTTFRALKDSVAIKDSEEFRQFLAKRMLLSLQPHMYKDSNGNFRADGEEVLREHVQGILNSGAFDLLSVKAHKLNCKQFMTDNDGHMPPGVDYSKEYVIQVRKK